MQRDNKWKLLNRKKVYGSKFLNVYEDKIELPNGSVIDDYTVIEKPSVVMIVATDEKDNIIILDEYKYAVGETLLTLPAGHLDKNELPVEAAKRELLEETGFSGGSFENLGILYDYPTKDIHKVYVIRAKNVIQTHKTQHEDTENINLRLISIEELKDQIKNREWKTSTALAAITISEILI